MSNVEFWSNQKMGIAIRNLVIRKEPNSQSKKVGWHYKGETFFIVPEEPVNGWFKITWTDAVTGIQEFGYVYGKFIKMVGTINEQSNEKDVMDFVSEEPVINENFEEQERTMMNDIHEVVQGTESKLNISYENHEKKEEEKKLQKEKKGLLSFIKKIFGIR